MKKIKDISAIITAAVMTVLFSIPCFAENVGDSSGNVATGVQLNWLPIAICGGALVVAAVVFVITMIIKKKKNNK